MPIDTLTLIGDACLLCLGWLISVGVICAFGLALYFLAPLDKTENARHYEHYL